MVRVKGIEEPIIIDPAGVPQDNSQIDRNITPFFGVVKDASEFAREIYLNKENYAGTTSSFPPGFHP